MIYKIILLCLVYFYIIKKFNYINYKYNLYDIPRSKRKIHVKPIPFSGGLFLLIFFNIFSLLFYTDNDYFFPLNDYSNKYILLIFINLFFLIGFLDDLKKFSTFNRVLFILILLITFNIFYSNQFIIDSLRFSFFNSDININNIKYPFTIFCFFVLINALNLYDGINGQFIIYVVFIFLVFYFYTTKIIFLLFLIPFLIFFYFNIKNKVFIGNGGVIFLTFIICFNITKIFNDKIILYCEEILLIMFLPGIDMLRVFFKRIISKKNPFKADKIHFHHILLTKYNLFTVLLITTSLSTLPFFLYKFLLSFKYAVLTSIFIFSLFFFKNFFIVKK